MTTVPVSVIKLSSHFAVRILLLSVVVLLKLTHVKLMLQNDCRSCTTNSGENRVLTKLVDIGAQSIELSILDV